MATTRGDVIEQAPPAAGDLRRYSDIRVKLTDCMETKGFSAVRAAEIANERWRQDLDAQIKAGLVDQDKFANYVKLVQETYSGLTAPRRTPQETRDAFARFKANVTRLNRLPIPAPMQPLPWGYVPEPSFSEAINAANEPGFATASIVNGNSADLETFAIGDPSGSAHVSAALASFEYEIPAQYVPMSATGGAVGFGSSWTISGDYDFRFVERPSWLNHSWKTELNLEAHLHIWAPGFSEHIEQLLSPVSRQGTDSELIEIGTALNFWKIAPVAIIPVPPNTSVLVQAVILATCVAAGSEANSARLTLHADIGQLHLFNPMYEGIRKFSPLPGEPANGANRTVGNHPQS